jgi:hypothetical protein
MPLSNVCAKVAETLFCNSSATCNEHFRLQDFFDFSQAFKTKSIVTLRVEGHPSLSDHTNLLAIKTKVSRHAFYIFLTQKICTSADPLLTNSSAMNLLNSFMRWRGNFPATAT